MCANLCVKRVLRLIIYVDVLMATNLFVNYFLLLVTKLLLRANISRKRLVLGAVLGSIYALVIFLPPLPTFVTLLMNTAASALIVLVSFPIHGIKAFLKTFAAFFSVNFAFAGAMLALWLAVRPNGMIYQNGTVYFDIDIKILIFSTVLVFLLLTLAFRLFRKKAPDNMLYDIEITNLGQTVTAKALLDTGHALSDGFSDTPVLVVSRRIAMKTAPPDVRAFLARDEVPEAQPAIRLIPYSTVRGTGVLKAFYAQSVRIPGKSYELKHILLALSEADFSNTEYEVLLCGDFFERGGTQNVHSEMEAAAAKNSSVLFSGGYPLYKRTRNTSRTAFQDRGGSTARSACGRGNKCP